MTQSRRHSLLEVTCSTAFGYVIAVSAQVLIFPLFGLYVPFHDNLAIGAIFTVISIARSYVFRRVFNRWVA